MTQSGRDLWLSSRSSATVTHRPPALVMTWDGRLDNRADLQLRLGIPSAQAGDPDLALAVFERFGIDGLCSLIGDWSLVIWDRASRTLHLGRDYMGTRPSTTVAIATAAWSSHLSELVERTGQRDALCDGFAAHFASLRPSPHHAARSDTLSRVLPACRSARADVRRTRALAARAREIRYRDARAYEEHLRALWRDALGARLRTEARCGPSRAAAWTPHLSSAWPIA